MCFAGQHILHENALHAPRLHYHDQGEIERIIYIYRTWFLFCFTSATETLVCMAAWSTHLYRATNDISALELFTLLSYLLQPQFLHYVVKLNPYIL
jgi:hypothetical protein